MFCYNKNKPIFLAILSIFLLFSSPILLAAKENQLIQAIEQNNTASVIKLLKAGATLQKQDNLNKLPSVAISEILLKNKYKPLDPNIFLDLVLGTAATANNPQKNSPATINKIIKQRDILAKLAIEKGADPQKIDSFYMFPSPDLSKFLLKKGLDPSKFLGMILAIRMENDDCASIALQKELIKLSLAKGADPKGFKYREYLETEEPMCNLKY